MNEVEVGRLLTAAKILDPKMPEPDDAGFVLKLWTRSLHDIPAQVAEEAMTEYYRSARYRENREPISPADIVQWHRDRRRYQQDAYPRADFDPELIHAGVDKAIAALASKKAIGSGVDPMEAADSAESETEDRRMARSVRCPYPPCGAGIGMACTGPGGKPLTKTLAHQSRLDAVYPQHDEGA